MEDASQLSYITTKLGHLLLWALRFTHAEARETSVLLQKDKDGDWIQSRNASISFYHRGFENDFMNDPWFTSLWALQEMILQPAAVWLAKIGSFCSINDRILNTHLFASSIKLAFWGAQIHEHLYFLLRHHQDEYTDSIGVNLADPAKISELRKTTGELNQFCELMSTINAKDISNDEMIDIFETAIFRMAPVTSWLQKVRREYVECFIEIDKWREFASGRACISLALEASRCAILVAGTKRRTKRRGARLS